MLEPAARELSAESVQVLEEQVAPDSSLVSELVAVPSALSPAGFVPSQRLSEA